MDVNKILDEMEEIIDSGSRIPLVGKVLVDAAMYDTFATVTTIIPGKSPCLS